MRDGVDVVDDDVVVGEVASTVQAETDFYLTSFPATVVMMLLHSCPLKKANLPTNTFAA